MVRTLLAVCFMAFVSYLPRVLPMAFMQKRIQSRFLRSFLYYVPFAVLGAMTFPRILYSTGNFYSSLLGMSVALILAFLDKGLMTVTVSALISVYLFQLLVP
ncbi:MAG TPA: branched-chain amino acid transporter [Firmicutes bacterium]|jgi:branched-subunit amino acid transport protein|nr:branched-chain amino acid transporter [Bacillota bacterium]HBT15413.1 branched-chain amino acid transporter [Bacillota bacterium]